MAKAAETINLKLAISPYDPMRPDTQKTLKGYKNVDKLLKPWVFPLKVKVNPNKWDEKSLKETMLAVARYDLALFDVRVCAHLKKLKKESDLVTAIKKTYETATKELTKKIENAVDEIEDENGESKEALANGKKALSKCDKFNAEQMAVKFRNDGVKALEPLIKDLESGKFKGKDDFELRMDKCKKILSKLLADFKKTTDEINKLIDYLVKNSKGFATDKGLAPAVQDLFKDIKESKKTAFKPWFKEVEVHEGRLDEANSLVDKARGKFEDLRGASGMMKNALALVRHENIRKKGKLLEVELKKYGKALKSIQAELK